MIINEYVLREMNQQRRVQVAGAVAAQRAHQQRPRAHASVFRRLVRTAARPRPVIDATGARSLAH